MTLRVYPGRGDPSGWRDEADDADDVNTVDPKYDSEDIREDDGSFDAMIMMRMMRVKWRGAMMIGIDDDDD